MAKKAAAQAPDYLTSLGIDPATQAAISAYYAPGGGFSQSMATEMVPTGQGGYTAAPAYQTAAPAQPISYPITTAPIQTQAPQQIQPVTPTPPPTPPPPPQATMNWSGLASSLQSMLAPYLTGGQSAAGQNPMAQIMPQLMSSLGGYLGQLQPTMAGQQAAADQTPLNPTATQNQGNMNWGQLGSTLQNWGGQNTQATQGSLMNQLLGYLGSMPNTATGANQPTSASTPLQVMNQNVPQYAIG